eukprot:253869-Chlamydomonas_euryale.AAC.3
MADTRAARWRAAGVAGRAPPQPLLMAVDGTSLITRTPDRRLRSALQQSACTAGFAPVAQQAAPQSNTSEGARSSTCHVPHTPRPQPWPCLPRKKRSPIPPSLPGGLDG